MRTFSISIASELPAAPLDVWNVVGTMHGVNCELAPLVRMTYPKAMNRLHPATMPIGRRAFR